MNTGNVYEHPTVSWDRARQAFDQIQCKEGELIDAWLELGRQLNVLRAKYPANQDFGAACQEHDIDLTHQHRSAAMWLAALDADQLDSLRQYNPTAIHPATLQNRCREQFPDWLITVRGVLHSVENGDDTAIVSENEPTAAPQATESENEAEESDEKNSVGVNNASFNNKMILVRKLDEETAKKIFNQWTHPNTRNAFNALAQMKGGPKVIRRIAGMVDDYCSDQNNGVYALQGENGPIKSFSHRLFFPGINKYWAVCYGCVWSTKSHPTQVKLAKTMHSMLDEMDDARKMLKEIGEDRPLDDYRQWWESRKADTAPRAGLDLSSFSKPAEEKPRIRAAEGSENDLIAAYGVEIWPAENPPYSFDEAWAAYQLWKTEDQALSTAHGFERTQARGRHFMSQCDYLNRVSKGFVSAWRKIAVAQYNNPESHEDCCCPHQQINVSK